MMRLTTSAGAELENPTAQDIVQAIGAVPLNPEFEAVISIDRDHFLQARTDPQLEPAGEGIALHGPDGAKHMFESKARHPPTVQFDLESTPGVSTLAPVLRVFHFLSQSQ